MTDCRRVNDKDYVLLSYDDIISFSQGKNLLIRGNEYGRLYHKEKVTSYEIKKIVELFK